VADRNCRLGSEEQIFGVIQQIRRPGETTKKGESIAKAPRSVSTEKKSPREGAPSIVANTKGIDHEIRFA
jgi:hypothetical protein